MWQSIAAFGTDQSGLATMEYAMIAGLVSLASVVSWTAMGDTLNTGYSSVSDAMTNAVSGPGSEQMVVEIDPVLVDKSGSPALR